MTATVQASPRYAKYAEPVDRESAREKLAVRLEEGARKRAEEEARPPADDKTPPTSRRRPPEKDEGGLVRDVVQSGAFKDFMRTAAREIARGMFKTGRR